MTEETAKKGMSKGCLVALIVVAVVLLLVIIAGVTCYLKKDQLARLGASTLVTSIKTEVNKNPAEGVDTARLNAVVDGFVAKLDESETGVEKLGPFLQSTQAISADHSVDSTEAEQFIQSMIDFFPELEQLVAPITVRPTEQKSIAIEKSSWETVDTIEVRGQVIYKGLHADTVFNVLKKSDGISDPDVRNDGYGNLIVTHHWKIDERYIDITFERWSNMYRVKGIKVLENKQPTLGED